MSGTLDRLRRNGAPGVNWVSPDPARVALEELVAAVEAFGEAYLVFDVVPPLVNARLTLALNAARNALKAGT